MSNSRLSRTQQCSTTLVGTQHCGVKNCHTLLGLMLSHMIFGTHSSVSMNCALLLRVCSSLIRLQLQAMSAFPARLASRMRWPGRRLCKLVLDCIPWTQKHCSNWHAALGQADLYNLRQRLTYQQQSVLRGNT